jgi:hypothetical protein
MPGCAGDYENPIIEWVWKGLTCKDCAWETMCKETMVETSRIKVDDMPNEIDYQVQTDISE